MFAGRQSFQSADKLAQILDPLAAKNDRHQAIVAALFMNSDDTSFRFRELDERAWLDYALTEDEVEAALDALITRGIVKEHGRYYGLAPIFAHEEFLTEFIKDNPRIDLSEKERAITQRVIDNAASYLGRPGFVLDERQIAAIWACFENRISFLAGPPGSVRRPFAR